MFPLSLLNYIYLIFKIFQSTAVHPIDKRIMLILTNTRYCLHQSLVGLELSFKETLYSNFKHVFLYRSSSIQCRHTLMKGYLYTNCNFLSQRSRIVLEKGCFVFYHFVNVRWVPIFVDYVDGFMHKNVHWSILTTYFIDRFHRPWFFFFKLCSSLSQWKSMRANINNTAIPTKYLLKLL